MNIQSKRVVFLVLVLAFASILGAHGQDAWSSTEFDSAKGHWDATPSIKSTERRESSGGGSNWAPGKASFAQQHQQGGIWHDNNAMGMNSVAASPTPTVSGPGAASPGIGFGVFQPKAGGVPAAHLVGHGQRFQFPSGLHSGVAHGSGGSSKFSSAQHLPGPPAARSAMSSHGSSGADLDFLQVQRPPLQF